MKKFLSALLVLALACSMSFGFAACGPVSDDNNQGNNGTPTTPGTPGNNDTPTTPDDKPNETPPKPELPAGTDYVQQLDYTESTANISNPDQGFYHPLLVTVTKTGATYSASAISTTRLCHLRFDLSAYSAAAGGSSEPLTQAALDGIANVFETMRKRDKNAVVRFCYDKNYGGNANQEPPLATMQKHAQQFCPIVEKYSAVVTALELGMVGPWGEMHTSTAAQNNATVNALIKTFLENTSTVPVTLRTPSRIYNYLGITVNDIGTYQMPESVYRLGLYNDGYLGSDNDLGTFTNRQKEVAFFSKQNEHLPYGGEVTVPESTLHNITTCLPEMYQMHLSYLNEEWNDTVVNGWKTATVNAGCAKADALYYGQTAYTYIQNHMGYRFVLKNSTFTYPEKLEYLKVSLTLDNVGFGNMYKKKHAKLLFADKNGDVKYSVDVGDFDGAKKTEFTAKLDTLNIKSGKYKIYLQLFGDYLTDYDMAIYCVQFANNNVYDSSLKANLIGEIVVPAKTA